MITLNYEQYQNKQIYISLVPEEACSGYSQNSDGLVISLLFLKTVVIEHFSTV